MLKNLLAVLVGLLFVPMGWAQSNIVDAFTQPGADACAKIQNGYNSLPSTGGTVDARGFQGTQTQCASGLSLTTKPAYILLDKAKIPLGANSIIIQHDAVRIVGAPSFQDQEGTQFTYSGTGAAVLIGNGTSEIYNVEFSGAQILAQGAATSGTGAGGIFCVLCLYTKMDQVSVRGFEANLGITFQGNNNGYGSTNELSQPFLSDNFFGIYTYGTSGTHASNQLRITGGFVTCSTKANSAGIYFDANSNLEQVLGIDIEFCTNGIVNLGGSNYISASHTENIPSNGTHIYNGGTSLFESGHSFFGAGTFFVDNGTGTRRCDEVVCQ